ncbi:hypothetical protein CE91St59_32290 [[Clostridium] scindens]|uniref:hypothetical protein n=1 Tax=Clostridium scindens (strain JCM 10418 / VPI 12708) TaxID=29347 RepID=UPI003091D62B|nr:hypothetical protein CE91St59_32290 [[Clostridium] scindens]BDF21666.1 hypothetical protein CE91St60_32490 [[Clostridium] scindens]
MAGNFVLSFIGKTFCSAKNTKYKSLKKGKMSLPLADKNYIITFKMMTYKLKGGENEGRMRLSAWNI